MRVLLAAIFCLCCAAAPTAATLIPLNFEQLVTNSAAVVLGRVLEVRGEFVSGGRGIESIVTVDVLKGLKGSAAETMQFTVPGGRAGRYLNLIPGTPVFEAGDLAVIFLTSRGARLPVTTGLTQGVYRVHNSGGQLMVMPPMLDTQLRRGDAQRKPISLAAFEASVRAASAKGARE